MKKQLVLITILVVSVSPILSMERQPGRVFDENHIAGLTTAVARHPGVPIQNLAEGYMAALLKQPEVRAQFEELKRLQRELGTTFVDLERLQALAAAPVPEWAQREVEAEMPDIRARIEAKKQQYKQRGSQS